MHYGLHVVIVHRGRHHDPPREVFGPFKTAQDAHDWLSEEAQREKFNHMEREVVPLRAQREEG